MSNYIDEQGFKIKIGVAYQYIYAMPGPSVTTVVIDSLNENGTVSGFDVIFNMRIDDMKPAKLFRPLKYGWNGKPERSAIIAHADKSALDLKP